MLCLFVGTAAIVDLRLMGLTMPTIRVTEVITRLLPWTAAGCITMITSGVFLFYAAPLARYQNIFFRAKMVALVLAGLNVWVFHNGVYRSVATWDLGPPPRRAKIAGGVALLLWVAVITLGRVIPYQVYWLDCAKQPQSAIVNLLAGCK
jgi:hypothetical protein